MKFIDESNQGFNKNKGHRNHVINIDFFSSQDIFKITNYVIRDEEGKPILSVVSLHWVDKDYKVQNPLADQPQWISIIFSGITEKRAEKWVYTSYRRIITAALARLNLSKFMIRLSSSVTCSVVLTEERANPLWWNMAI